MSLELYPFRFKDPVTGKWVRARYRATVRDIAARYATWEITGPVVRPASPSTGFDPFRKLVGHADWARLTEPAPQVDARCADAVEVALVEIFTPGSNVSGANSFRLVACFMMLSLVRLSPACFSTCTMVWAWT